MIFFISKYTNELLRIVFGQHTLQTWRQNIAAKNKLYLCVGHTKWIAAEPKIRFSFCSDGEFGEQRLLFACVVMCKMIDFSTRIENFHIWLNFSIAMLWLYSCWNRLSSLHELSLRVNNPFFYNQTINLFIFRTTL